MMSIVLAVLAAGWIGYTLFHASDRPGLFGGLMISTYGFSIYLGGIGGFIGLLGLLLALAELARHDDRPMLAAELALLAWAALSLVSAFYAREPDIALRGAQFLVAFAGSAYLYGRAFGDRPGCWQDIALAGGISLLLCEPGVLSHAAANRRLSGELNAAGISFLVDAPAIACLTLLILDDTLRGWRRAGLAAVLFLVLLPIAISFGTRGTFLGAGAAILLLAARRLSAPNAGRFLLRFAGAGIALAATLVAIGAALWTAGAIQMLKPLARSFAFVETGGRYDSSAHERLAEWYDAWSLTQDAPLFGHGIYSFGYLTHNPDVHPHNMVLDILVSTGFAGLALFLAGLAPIAIAGLRRMFARPIDLAAAFAICLLADLLVRHQMSTSMLAGRSLFLAMGMIVAQCHPGRARLWAANGLQRQDALR
jgi:O-antigen ligase